MPELNDHELLAEFARGVSETAFAALVARHVNLVYAAALRHTGNRHHAEEITQAVFIILARKAGGLRRGTVLSGWLYQTARLTAANFRKGEIRRQRREQEAFMQSTLNEPDAAAWEEIAPLLDEAMGRLGETDRNAIVLRFFENKTASEVAATLQLKEAAAHKRVARGLEKLRRFFTKRGVVLTAAAIGGALAANSVQAAPAGLAVSTIAAAKGVALTGSISATVNGALKLMAWAKLKAAAIVAAVGILAVGTGAIAIKVATASPAASAGGPIKFEAFLQHTPTITKAVFLWEPHNPEGARETIFLARHDEAGTLLYTITNVTDQRSEHALGIFNGVPWYLAHQSPQGQLRATSFDELYLGFESHGQLAQAYFGVLAGGGVPNINRDRPVVWDKGRNRFLVTLKDAYGVELPAVIKLEYSDGLPASASVEAPAGGTPMYRVKYEYDKNFRDGMFPVQYTTTRASENETMWIVRLQQLEVSVGRLPASEMDPRLLFNVGNDGQPVRIRTPGDDGTSVSEFRQNQPSPGQASGAPLAGRPASRLHFSATVDPPRPTWSAFWRIVLISAVCLLAATGWWAWRRKAKGLSL
jgi:RNA polymerase sigma factor (sigma-70 family)